MDFYGLLDQLLRELKRRRANPDETAWQENKWDYSPDKGEHTWLDSNPVYNGAGMNNVPGGSRVNRAFGLEMMNPDVFNPYPQNQGYWDLNQGLEGMLGYGGTLDRPPEVDSPLSELRSRYNRYR